MDTWKRFCLNEFELVEAFLNDKRVFYVNDSREADPSVSSARIDEITPDEDHPGEIKEIRMSYEGVRYWVVPRRERYRIVTRDGAIEFLREYGLIDTSIVEN